MSLDWKDRERWLLKHTGTCDKALDTERFGSEELTGRYGPVEEDRIGHEDEQHRRVRGDVVRDGVLKALLAAAPKKLQQAVK